MYVLLGMDFEITVGTKYVPIQPGRNVLPGFSYPIRWEPSYGVTRNGLRPFLA